MSERKTRKRIHRRAVLSGALLGAMAGLAMADPADPRRKRRPRASAGEQRPARPPVIWIGHL